jgi:hypothetical protein
VDLCFGISGSTETNKAALITFCKPNNQYRRGNLVALYTTHQEESI